MAVVFVTGIFDLLHVEHVRFLAAAKNQGRRKKGKGGRNEPYLIVGIESDKRVRKLKGTGRPMMGQQHRKELLQAFRMVDRVFILPEQFDTNQDYERIMQEVNPDMYAVSENSSYLENKRRICEKLGVQFVIVHPHNPEVSTTRLIDRICRTA